MAKTTGVDPSRVFELQEKYREKAHIAMKNNDEHFFLGLEAFLKADYQQKTELIERVLGRKFGEEKSFIVGEVFQHRNLKLVPLYFARDFESMVLEPSKNKRVSINAFGNNTLKEYVLPKNMEDTTIQSATNSTPMEEDQFWAMLYLLIVEPELGKKILNYQLRKYQYYVFHVKLSSGKVLAVRLFWHDGKWRLNAFDFNHGNWSMDSVFLFPTK